MTGSCRVCDTSLDCGRQPPWIVWHVPGEPGHATGPVATTDATRKGRPVPAPTCRKACASAVDCWKGLRRDVIPLAADLDYQAFVSTTQARPLTKVLLEAPDLNTALEAARSQGLGRLLTSHVLAWTSEAGYRAVTADWRETNLLASRFWPARGFRPIFQRLHRVIGIG